METILNRQYITQVKSNVPGFSETLSECNRRKDEKKASPMARLKQKLSFNRKKKDDSKKKPLQWQEDEKAVRIGTRSFDVKYLGCTEVQESRGMYICEQAIQVLLSQKSKHMKAILHVSGDALRLVDETNKTLIVDQTIEKVSFCAPTRHHQKGFAYICRDGTSRRWLCHGFFSLKETGERLSHTVGCAFQVCLERKQERGVTAEYTRDETSFTRFGSFRPISLNERMMDPQSALIAEPIPLTPLNSRDTAIERPRPRGNSFELVNRSISMRSDNSKSTLINQLHRQGSLRTYEIISNPLITTNTIPEEDNEMNSTINNFPKISLYNEIFHSISTASTISFPSPPITHDRLTSSFYSLNSPSIHSNQTSPSSSHDTFNPFSPYIQTQSNTFSTKHSTNPFEDDLLLQH